MAAFRIATVDCLEHISYNISLVFCTITEQNERTVNRGLGHDMKSYVLSIKIDDAYTEEVNLSARC